MADNELTREVARRVLATEFNDAERTFQESDDERAPRYALLPTGEKANRIFVVGTLTETEDVGDSNEYWRGRVVGPTDTFFTYAGQYQPDAERVLKNVNPPAYVSIVGKPRTYETDDGEVNVSLRPESITVVDEATRNRWIAEAASETLARIDRASAAVDNSYVEMAADTYEQSPEAYVDDVIEALESLEEDTASSAEASEPADTSPTDGADGGAVTEP